MLLSQLLAFSWTGLPAIRADRRTQAQKRIVRIEKWVGSVWLGLPSVGATSPTAPDTCL